MPPDSFPVRTGGPGTPAGLARRLASLAYEALLLVALFVVAGFVLLPLTTPLARTASAGIYVLSPPERVLSFAYYLAVGACYFVWSWTGGRRTLPMKTWRLALRSASGEAPATTRALARYLAAWIGPLTAAMAYALGARWGLLLAALNFAWALIDPERQFLHDRLAGTRIVYLP